MTFGGQPSHAVCQFCAEPVAATDDHCPSCGAALQRADAVLPPDSDGTSPSDSRPRSLSAWALLALAFASPAMLSFGLAVVLYLPHSHRAAPTRVLGLLYTGLSLCGGGLLGALCTRRGWCGRSQAVGIMLLSAVSAYCNWLIISLLIRRP